MSTLKVIFLYLLVAGLFIAKTYSQVIYGPDKVKVFTPIGSDSFGNNQQKTYKFWAIEIDDNDIVWAASDGYGLFKYENSKWTNFPDTLVSAADMLGLEVDSNNNPWFTCQSAKRANEIKDTTLCRYMVPDSIFVSDNGFACVISSGNNIYYAGFDSGLFKFDGSTWTKYDSINDTIPLIQVRSFVKDSKGNIWFSNNYDTVNILVKFDGNSFSIFSTEKAYSPQGFFYGLAVDKNDNIWYGTSLNTIMEFDGQNFIPHPSPAGVNLNFITAIAVDKYDNKWICADNASVYKLKNNTWTQFKFSDMGLYTGYPTIWATDIAVDSRNNLWMATNWAIVEFNEFGLNSDTAVIENSNDIPSSYKLSQNYPNPFNPATTIVYRIPKAGLVTLKIYDMLGREVRTLLNEEKPAGSYNISFNASALASGIYFYRITAGDFSSVKKMVLLK